MENVFTVITGGLGGLGSAFADECAQRGKNIILVDRHLQGDDLVAYLSQKYPQRIEYFPCNLSLADDRNSLLSSFKENGYQFDGLINIVGQEMEGPFLDRSRLELMYMLDLNIEAMVDLCSGILDLRQIDQRFLLVNIASLAGFFPMPNKAIYAASKRFIINFSLGLREEIKDFANVTVVCPAGLPTNAESMKKIFLQGFWGKITAHDISIVVRKSLNKVEKNIPMYIPGLSNKIMAGLSKYLPQAWLARYLSKRWRGKQAQLELWRMVEKSRK